MALYQIPNVVPVGDFFKAPPYIFFSNSTISQPVVSNTVLIPNVINPLRSLPTVVTQSTLALSTSLQISPTIEGAWLSETISQPYFTPWDVNNVITPFVNVGTYFKSPPAPGGVASVLNDTISEPYFTPYDVNQLVWPANETTYSKSLPTPGCYLIQFDGSQNYISLGTMGNYGSNFGNGFYASFKIKTTSTALGDIVGTLNSNFGMGFYIRANISANVHRIFIQDNSANLLEAHFTNAWSDGNLHTVVVTANFGSAIITVTVDGVSQTITYDSQQTLTTFTNFTHAITLGALNNQSSIQNNFTGIIGSLTLGTSVSSIYGYYYFPEGSGTTTQDFSGKGNTGILTGSPLPLWVECITPTWFNQTIYQPFFTPWDVNMYWIKPVDPGTYKTVSKIAFSIDSIGQPIFAQQVLIPGVRTAGLPYQVASTTAFGTVALKTTLEQLGQASWLDDTISQPFFTPWDENYVTVAPVNVSTYFKAPPAPTGTASWLSNTIAQPFAHKQFIPPWDENIYGIPPVNVGTYSKPVPPPSPEPWLPTDIAQPYFTPYDVNQIVWPPSPATYFKTPPAPTGTASWLVNTIAQPYITPWEENIVGIPPVNVGTYFKALPAPNGTASWLLSTISQPFSQKQFIPPYDVNWLVWPASESTYFKAPPAPTGTASWLLNTISQPFFVPWDENIYGIPPVNVSTYFKAPPPPIGESDWLGETVSQPFFTPYDVNQLVWPASESTYFKAPVAPTGTASWLSTTVSQPFFTPWDENWVGIPPVNVGTYFKAPPAPVGTVSWLSNTIAQPFAHTQIIPPYDINWIVWPASESTYFKAPVAPTGFASWASNVISQPYITPWDENYIGIPPVNVGTYFKAPPAPTGVASWLDDVISQPLFIPYPLSIFTDIFIPHPVLASNSTLALLTLLERNVGTESPWLTQTISQPFFTPWDENPIGIPPVNVSTYFKAPPAPQGVASWLNVTVSQPFFTPWDENIYVWPPSIGTYFKAPPPPTGVASWLQNSIAQPFAHVQFIPPWDENIIGVPPVNVGTYFKAPLPPTGEADWLGETVSQPFFTPWDENLYVWPASPATYFKAPPAPQGTASWLQSTIAQPFFTPWDENPVGIPPVNVGTYYKALPAPTGIASWLSNTISQPFSQKQFIPPYDVNQIVWPASPATYYKAPPAPQGAASWLSSTIAQPFFTPWDENIYTVAPINVGTYFKAPPAPTGIASWLSSTVSQPFSQKQFIPPYDVNEFVWPASESTYFKAPPAPQGFASWADNTISQPLFIPLNGALWVVWLFESGAYWPTFRNINIALLTSLISTALFSTLALLTNLEGKINSTVALLTNLQPPATTGASLLTETITQPYFTPYDVNQLVWPASPSTYYKAPPAPVGTAAWLPNTISQPYFTPWDVNIIDKDYSFPNPLRALDANHNYALAFNGIDNYLSLGTMGNFGSNLGSGFYISLQIQTTYNGNNGAIFYFNHNSFNCFARLDTNGTHLYFQMNGNTSGQLSAFITTAFNDGKTHTLIITANTTSPAITFILDGVSITPSYTSQQALVGFVNFVNPLILMGENPGSSFTNFLPGAIDNLQIGTSNDNLYGSYRFNEGTGTTTADLSGNGNTGTFPTSYPVWVHGFSDAPIGVASWLSQSIAQPFFTPWDQNQYNVPFVNVGTYFKAPPPPKPEPWLQNVISQPYFTPYDVNSIVWPASEVTYFKAPPAPIGIASWLSNSVSQPFSQKQFIPPYDVNQFVWPASEATYYKAPVAPTGVASWLGSTISQPLFIPLSTWIFRTDWNFIATTLIPRNKQSTVALRTTLETTAIKSTVALLTTLSKTALSTVALSTTLESFSVKSTVALLTTLAKPVVSTLALKTTLEVIPQFSTVALKTTLESAKKASTIALSTSLNRSFASSLALLTTLQFSKNSTTALYTILEKRTQKTVALSTTLAHPVATLALLTLLTYGSNRNLALLTLFSRWILHRPKQLDKEGAFLNISTPRGGRSRF